MEKALIILSILFLFGCEQEPITPPAVVTPPTVNEPDSIKYVVSDNIGCRITWRDENGLPKVEQVQNLKSFTKKVKAIAGVEYIIECQNSAMSYSYIYLNDSLVDADQASDFVYGCFSQWTYQ